MKMQDDIIFTKCQFTFIKLAEYNNRVINPAFMNNIMSC